jgi:hypothetical protein
MIKSLILLAAVVVGVLAMSAKVKAAPSVGGEPTTGRTPAQIPNA